MQQPWDMAFAGSSAFRSMLRWIHVPEHDPKPSHFPRICVFADSCLPLSAQVPLTRADDSSRISTNPDFADGLKGWQTQGDVHLVTSSANPAKHAVTIGPGAGSISQRIAEGAANHMMIEATLHSVPAGGATLSVRCLDKDGRELMTLRSPVRHQAGQRGRYA